MNYTQRSVLWNFCLRLMQFMRNILPRILLAYEKIIKQSI